ncbi:hypothetical protein BGP_2180 [Beggiatoa sp. PS]|nr:hypothetical protein BGP_2180 [Beggiatoa sp. PS]
MIPDYQFLISNSRLPIPNSRLPIPNSQFPEKQDYDDSKRVNES